MRGVLFIYSWRSVSSFIQCRASSHPPLSDLLFVYLDSMAQCDRSGLKLTVAAVTTGSVFSDVSSLRHVKASGT
jgi:hypothetical protein